MRTCDLEGCERKHIAKGLCQFHYVKAQRQSRGREADATHQYPCAAGCGETVLRTRTQARRFRPTCSDACKYVVTYGRAKPTPSRELVGPITVDKPTVAPKAEPAQSKPRFISVNCHWCAAPFIHDLRVTGVTSLYCSRRCSRSRGKSDRKGREHGATGTFTLAELVRLWLAFGKCCAYCEQPTNGLPDPDHVMPLSRGGSNSITNILPCCHLCNSDKWDMTLDEWPADRVRRGLPPRRTTWERTDPRARHLVTSKPTRERWVISRAA